MGRRSKRVLDVIHEAALRGGSLEDTQMQILDIPFGTTNWSAIEKTEHKGETGVAYWRTRSFGPIRVRMVEYSAGYLADHWCSKGHILLCIEGVLGTELKDGRSFTLTPGVSYQVADGAEPHRSFTEVGAKLFIVD
jgi:hypothetical protein